MAHLPRREGRSSLDESGDQLGRQRQFAIEAGLNRVSPIEPARLLVPVTFAAADEPPLRPAIVPAQLEIDPPAGWSRRCNYPRRGAGTRPARDGNIDELLVLPRHLCSLAHPVDARAR